MRKLLNPILKLFFNPNRIVNALHIQSQVNAEYHARFRQREEMDPLFYEVIHNLVVEVTRLGIEVHNLKMRAESLSSRMDFDERRGRSLESVVQYRQPPQQRPDRDRQQNPQQQRPPQQNRQDSGRSDQARNDQPRGDQPRNDQARFDQPRQDQPRADQPRSEGQPSIAGNVVASSDSTAPRPEGGFRPEGANTGGQGGPRPDGDRRRRRRRRRRRPGQTMADGNQPQAFGQSGGAPSQGGMAGAESHGHEDVGDDGGADDHGDSDTGDHGHDQDPDPGDQ
jgi:hypothetical protein